MLRKSRRSVLQHQFQQVDAALVSMLRNSPGEGSLTDTPRVPWREPRQDLSDSRSVGGHQDLAARVEAVVNRHAASRTEALVRRYHRWSAAIGQNHVINRDQLVERILGICPNPIECRRRVDIPEHRKRARPLYCGYSLLQQSVENS